MIVYMSTYYFELGGLSSTVGVCLGLFWLCLQLHVFSKQGRYNICWLGCWMVGYMKYVGGGWN